MGVTLNGNMPPPRSGLTSRKIPERRQCPTPSSQRRHRTPGAVASIAGSHQRAMPFWSMPAGFAIRALGTPSAASRTIFAPRRQRWVVGAALRRHSIFSRCLDDAPECLANLGGRHETCKPSLAQAMGHRRATGDREDIGGRCCICSALGRAAAVGGAHSWRRASRRPTRPLIVRSLRRGPRRAFDAELPARR